MYYTIYLYTLYRPDYIMKDHSTQTLRTQKLLILILILNFDYIFIY